VRAHHTRHRAVLTLGAVVWPWMAEPFQQLLAS
jgi:hypothetical protein